MQVVCVSLHTESMSEEQLSGAFWGGDDLSEEEEEEIEEESEEEYSSDGGIFSDSDDEEEERGPVLSGEEKAERDLDAAVAKFREEMSANNWIGVQKGMTLPLLLQVCVPCLLANVL